MAITFAQWFEMAETLVSEGACDTLEDAYIFMEEMGVHPPGGKL